MKNKYEEIKKEQVPNRINLRGADFTSSSQLDSKPKLTVTALRGANRSNSRIVEVVSSQSPIEIDFDEPNDCILLECEPSPPIIKYTRTKPSIPFRESIRNEFDVSQ